jgi:radical SAM-linked protein
LASQAVHGDEGEGQFLYLIQYSKLDALRYYGQLEIAQGLIRAVRRSGLPAVYSSGFHPHLKLSFEEALPLGMESLAENAVLTLSEKMEPEAVRAALDRETPDGLRVVKVSALKRKPERPATVRVTYRVSGIPESLADDLGRTWRLQAEEMLFKETKRGRVTAPLHAVLVDLRRIDEQTIEMDLLEGKNLCFRPVSILKLLLKEQLEDYRVCKMSVSRWDDHPGRSISVPDAVEGRCSECPPRSS